MVAPEPETDRARGLREQMSAARWESVVGEALERVRVIETVRVRRQETGESWRKCLSAVAPETGWSKYSHWRRRYEEVEGPAWERLRVIPRTPSLRDGLPAWRTQRTAPSGS